MTKNLNKRERHAQILDAAMRVAAHKNYSTLTAEDIANAAGVTKGLLFYHFENMRGLRREIARRAVSERNLTIIAHGIVADDPVIRQIPDGLKNEALRSLRA